MTQLTLVSSNKMFEGKHERYSHQSNSTQTEMTFAIYLPPQALKGEKVPVLYWLSGLTCNDENFSTKAGAQQYAAQLGLALVMPDTSPRGDDAADDDNYDLGQGAGFYLNATQAPWQKHYQMYDYITQELPQLIEENFSVSQAKSIFGHSMGGHGALQIALKNSDTYAAVSAFAPIVNPCDTPWGKKAFSAYLGEDQSTWEQYDSLKLLSVANKKIDILIDQGTADNFYPEQLQPEVFVEEAKKQGYNINFTMREGYDHSYFFIATFVEEHMKFHARALGL